MSRIAYAQYEPKKLQTLRAKALNAINDYVKEACGSADVDPRHIHKVVIVGNTCMHHIVLGIDVSYVGLAPYAPVVRDLIVVPAPDMPLKVAKNAQVCFLPIVAGFVGADTMACVLATRIYESEETRGLVDIGTNGEVIIGSKDRLMACSAPAGPALEGAQIRDGMRGAPGAIEKVEIGDDVTLGVIGGVPPVGICGSGLIDACAKMIDAGVMNSSGRLEKDGRDALPARVGERIADTPDGSQFILSTVEDSGRDSEVVLTQGDIRQLQLAKSAIYSGIVMLQNVMEVSDDELAELMLCGGFGNYIDTASAVKIRLLPSLPLEKISYVGNAALMGAQMALLSEAEWQRAGELLHRIEHVALAARPDFQD
ncbi:MAG: ASKHA domain-containing protein, partial [Gammaproteobacteria bacterium]|nr:ASKHA domain-containing protein [Gammaproteobacteria bacterium]